MKKENVSKHMKKVTINLALWTLSWLLTLALATFGPKFIWQERTTWSILAIAINTLIGVGLIRHTLNTLAHLMNFKRKFNLMPWV